MDENGILKTALEIAMERSRRTNVPEAELEGQEYYEKGKELAGKYLKSGKFDMSGEFEKFKGEKKKKAMEGFEFVLLYNLAPPASASSLKDLRKVLEGLVLSKKNKKEAAAVCGELEQVFSEYLEQRGNIMNQLKKKYQSKMDQARKATEKQAGMRLKMDVERLPEFQKDWSGIMREMNAEFDSLLAGYKGKLKSLPAA